MPILTFESCKRFSAIWEHSHPPIF